MLTGNIVFVCPIGSRLFGGPRPTPIACINSVGGVLGKNFTESNTWYETCKMFRY